MWSPNKKYWDDCPPVLKVPVDQDVEREKRGYQILQDTIIKCANCQKELVEVIKIKENKKIKNAIKALCPYCNDCSFWCQITGEIALQAVEGLYMIDMPMDIRNDVRFTTIKVAK